MHGHGMISFFFEAVFFFSMDWFQGPPETQSIAQDFDPLIKALKDILVGQARSADDCHNCYTEKSPRLYHLGTQKAPKESKRDV